MRSCKIKKTLLGAAIVVSASSANALYAGERKLSCRYISTIQEGYLNQHVNHKKINSELEKRITDQYLKKLDPMKIYFLKSDESKIKKMLSKILKKTQNSECSAIFNVNAYLVSKVEERVKFVKKALGKKYVFNKETKITLDSDKRKRFSSLKRLNKYHTNYLHFQISNYLMSDTKIAEAKENVIKNYERLLKKLKKETEEDHLAGFLDTYAHTLDPHSSFFSADALENFKIQMSLSLEGIGATLSWKDGFTVVESLVPGGAAEKSGRIKSKDKIVAVRQDGIKKAENVIDIDLGDVVKKIRGKKGTKVFLTVLRKDDGKTKRLEIMLLRDKIKLEDEAAKITYHKKKVGKKEKLIGLIDLPSFYSDGRRGGRSAAKDMKKLLKQAAKKKVAGLVLDLSRNGGGSLDDAVKIAGLFIKTGNVVKQSFPDPNTPAMPLADVDSNVDYSGPLVILTSRASASASEIVSGALKDYGRAVIVGGDHTFGKGTVQTVRDLPKGLGALKVTVGMFFTAGGYSTQHRGVEADVVLPSVFSRDDIGENTYDYSLPPKKLASFISSDAFVHDGSGRWQIIDKKIISKLKKESSNRVVKSEKFKEVLEEIKKNKEREKVLYLAEVMKENEKDKKENKDKKKDVILSRKARDAKKFKEYMERADIQEALDVVSDLVALHANKPVTLGAREIKRKASSVKQ